jgi:hypothetical protein
MRFDMMKISFATYIYLLRGDLWNIVERDGSTIATGIVGDVTECSINLDMGDDVVKSYL